MSRLREIDNALAASNFDAAQALMADIAHDLHACQQQRAFPTKVMEAAFSDQVRDQSLLSASDHEFARKLRLALGLIRGVESAEQRLGLEQ